MLIKVHTQGFTLSEAINTYAVEKVRLALSLYRGKIRRADVFLADANGPKGGVDMHCKIKIKADGCASIFAQDTAEDLYDAINGCSQRARRAVDRRMDRIFQRRRRPRGLVISET